LKIVGMAQIYNEVKSGDLKRCLDHYSKLCDEIVILDDASDDGSYELEQEYTGHIIRNEKNAWDKNLETQNKALLLGKTLELSPDWIISFDADEIYEKKLENRKFLENMLRWATVKEINSLSFNWFHLWLSENWYRTDKNLSIVSPPRMWRNIGNLEIDITPGLHQRLHPIEMENPYFLNITIVHYNSSSVEKLVDKIVNYMRLDTSRDYLSVLNSVELGEVDYDWFNDCNMPMKQLCPDLEQCHDEIRQQVVEKWNQINSNTNLELNQLQESF
jgi:glycosyltransferase involved in cell wall biosynthesis